MHKATINANGCELSFTDSDVCNPDDAIWQGDYNPHNVHLWLIHDHGSPVAVVWASNLQDALDEAADSGKLDSFQVDEADAEDYGGDIYNCDSLANLGNAGDPFDIEALGYVEFAAPPLSLAALFSGVHINALNSHFA